MFGDIADTLVLGHGRHENLPHLDGWRVLEHLGYEELAEWYVKPTGREVLSTPLERLVCAEKLWAPADGHLRSEPG